MERIEGGFTVKALLVALATERQCRSISSSKTSLVSSIPRATIAKLSPTRIMSMPAASATCALGKSWAVITVIGSPFWKRLRSVPIVTFFLGLAKGVPMGECELCLTCCNEVTKGRAASWGGRVLRTTEAHDRIRVEVEGMDMLGRSTDQSMGKSRVLSRIRDPRM